MFVDAFATRSDRWQFLRGCCFSHKGRKKRQFFSRSHQAKIRFRSPITQRPAVRIAWNFYWGWINHQSTCTWKFSRLLSRLESGKNLTAKKNTKNGNIDITPESRGPKIFCCQGRTLRPDCQFTPTYLPLPVLQNHSWVFGVFNSFHSSDFKKFVK